MSTNKQRKNLTHLYTDGVEIKRFREDQVPANWFRAPKKQRKKKKHITDGINYKLVDIDYPIPEGWYKGIPEARKLKISMTESGKPKSNHQHKAAKEYWTKARANKHWYTNGIIDNLFEDGLQPEGWIRGQAESRKTKNSASNKGKKMSTESAIKRVATRRRNGTYKVSEATRLKLSLINSGKKMKPETIKKINDTKRANNTFSTSAMEKCLKNMLQYIYNDAEVEYNSDPRYPYRCDIYLPRNDLFIELNGHWVHGKHPFNPNNLDDLETLKWIRSKQDYHTNSKGKQVKNLYFGFEDTWTLRDPSKLAVAKKNKLNYVVLYNINRKNMISLAYLDFEHMHGINIIDIENYYREYKNDFKEYI